jgi:hypothetical protein
MCKQRLPAFDLQTTISPPMQPKATAKPLAHAQLSDKLWSMPNVTFKNKNKFFKYRMDTIYTDKHTKGLAT